MEKDGAPPALVSDRIRHDTVTLNFSRSTSLRLEPARNAAFFYSAEVFSVPAIAKLQRHDAGRARIAVIAS
jgi:hypothetical protein